MSLQIRTPKTSFSFFARIFRCLRLTGWDHIFLTLRGWLLTLTKRPPWSIVSNQYHNVSFHTEKKADSVYLKGAGGRDWYEHFCHPAAYHGRKLWGQIGRRIDNGIRNDSEIQETRVLFWGESGRGLKVTNPRLQQNRWYSVIQILTGIYYHWRRSVEYKRSGGSIPAGKTDETSVCQLPFTLQKPTYGSET